MPPRHGEGDRRRQEVVPPAQGALPRPKKGDDRVLGLQYGLAPTWGETRDGPPTLAELLGPESNRALQQAIPQMLARLDALGRRQLQSVSRAAAGCKYGQDLPVTSDSFTGDLAGGMSLEATMRTGPDGAALTLGFEKKDGARTVRVSVDLNLCDLQPIQAEQCPTAEGVLDGTDNSGGTITIQVLDGGSLEFSQTSKVKIETKLRGKVDDDAKLDSLDVDRTEVYDIKVDHGRWLGAGQKVTVRRRTRVNMRTGQYDWSPSSMEIQQVFSGVLSFIVNQNAARTILIRAVQQASDRSWAAGIDNAIKGYRERENAWQSPNTCASLEFTPKSNTLRLRNGQAGRFTGKVEAKRGGTSAGRWTLAAQRKLTVSPARAEGRSAQFSYRVTGQGSVMAEFKVTSKAGVARGKWEQGGSAFPKRIEGTFSGTTVAPSGSGDAWSGTVTFVLVDQESETTIVYGVEKVSYTTTHSLNESGCSGSATGSASLGGQEDYNGLFIYIPPEPGEGYRYVIQSIFQGPMSSITITCPHGSFASPWQVNAALHTVPNNYYSDLKTFSGTNALQGWSVTWNLRATG